MTSNRVNESVFIENLVSGGADWKQAGGGLEAAWKQASEGSFEKLTEFG
jgi:hypothetical protein